MVAMTRTAATTPLPPDNTPIFSKTPSLKEWVHRDSLATSLLLLVLNVRDPVGVGLKTNGSVCEAWKSLEDVYGRVTDLGLSRAVRELNSMYLATNAPMGEHITTMCRLWVAASDVGAKIEDAQFRMIFMTSLNEDWRHVIPVLRTFVTSTEVINFVLEEAETNTHLNPPIPTTTLATNTFNNAARDAQRAAHKNQVCTNTTCSAEGKKGHTIDECFWPGRGKEGQWPSWW
jgi:hypothetical protein